MWMLSSLEDQALWGLQCDCALRAECETTNERESREGCSGELVPCTCRAKQGASHRAEKDVKSMFISSGDQYRTYDVPRSLYAKLRHDHRMDAASERRIDPPPIRRPNDVLDAAAL